MAFSILNSHPVSYQTLVKDGALVQKLQKRTYSKEAAHRPTHNSPLGGLASAVPCDVQAQGGSLLTGMKVTGVTHPSGLRRNQMH